MKAILSTFGLSLALSSGAFAQGKPADVPHVERALVAEAPEEPVMVADVPAAAASAPVRSPAGRVVPPTLRLRIEEQRPTTPPAPRRPSWRCRRAAGAGGSSW